VEVGNADVSGVDVRVTNRLSTVLGSVRDSRNEPLASYVVLVFSADESHWGQLTSRRSATATPDQNGVYRVRALAPGSYYAIALPDMPDEWGNPELLEELKKGAEEFTLSEGESKTIDLTLRQ
jgi:hypothetical protein